MSLPAISKHLKVLERAGLIARGARRNGGFPARSRPVAKSPPGSSTTAASGRRVLTAWMNIFVRSKERNSNMTTQTDQKRRMPALNNMSVSPTGGVIW